MTNYQITIGYRAVITVDVKAKSEAEAKKKAIEANGWGLNEVCPAQPFKFTTTLHRHISFKPLSWDVFLKF